MTSKSTIAHYKQESYEYPEDNWERNLRVSSAECVFEFMRECYIADAYNRNDYPLVSCWEERVKFYEQEHQVCDLGHVHFGEKRSIAAPEYYQEGAEMYNTWKARIKRTLTHLRKAETKSEEKAAYERLKKRYA